jgi:hypothetical protein
MIEHYNYHKPATSIVPHRPAAVKNKKNIFFIFFANHLKRQIGRLACFTTGPLYRSKVVGQYNYLIDPANETVKFLTIHVPLHRFNAVQCAV